MKMNLERYKTAEDNLLFWIKEYLSYKALQALQNSSEHIVDDIISSIDLIKKSKSIDEVKLNTNLLVRDGLDSLSRVNNAVYKFYIFTTSRIESIKDIDTNLLQDLKEWLTIGKSTTKSYIDAILELLVFIKNSNSDKYEFDIDESIVRVSKKSVPSKIIDVMDDVEFERFGSMLIKYDKYKDDYQRAMYIFLVRVLLFSGITVSELLTLKLGESFIIDDKSILVRLKNRKRDIDLPRALILPHFNKYKELSLKEHSYDVMSNVLFSITRQRVDATVKELLEFSGIKRKPLTPLLIRYSFLVYVYNKRNADNEISFKTIHEISGIANKKELERILNTFDKENVSIAKAFNIDKF